MSLQPLTQLRPGVGTGRYPERTQERDGWVMRAARRVGGALRQHAPAQLRRYRTFVARVERAGEPFAAASEAALDEEIRSLRHMLRSGVLDARVAARVFALVREVSSRELGMAHFPVQLAGGWAMLNGRIAEMQTGEGKTLTATLTAATAALAGIPVHVITVNDYLVQRDAQAMGPVYQRLGLSVGSIADDLTPEERRAAYACDVTYVSNKQIAFDYLRDRIELGGMRDRFRLQVEGLHQEAPRLGKLLLRGLCFAIVDEADSVLVDEARTPLVISRQGKDPFQQEVYGQALELTRTLRVGEHFMVRSAERAVELTAAGSQALEQAAASLGGLWSGVRRREELARLALAAQHLYLADHHYLVRDDKVQIVDEFTGRVMPDRNWEHGLHQMVEAKEGCELTGQLETVARISYQRFFRRYLLLSGMTGTAREVAGELWSVYGLTVAPIPTHRASRRRLNKAVVYCRAQDRWRGIVDRVRQAHERGQAVLIGTRSVEASEHLAQLLQQAGLNHRVLNARQDQEEAAIVGDAGQAGCITVATNMAGRGTDIVLGEGVAQNGGLHVIASERHEARRIDRQLIGRCARQGDPGSADSLASLDDELVTDRGASPLIWLATIMAGPDGVIPGWFGELILRRAQRAAEQRHARARKDLLVQDERLGDLLAFSGPME